MTQARHKMILLYRCNLILFWSPPLLIWRASYEKITNGCPSASPSRGHCSRPAADAEEGAQVHSLSFGSMRCSYTLTAQHTAPKSKILKTVKIHPFNLTCRIHTHIFQKTLGFPISSSYGSSYLILLSYETNLFILILTLCHDPTKKRPPLPEIILTR